MVIVIATISTLGCSRGVLQSQYRKTGDHLIQIVVVSVVAVVQLSSSSLLHILLLFAVGTADGHRPVAITAHRIAQITIPVSFLCIVIIVVAVIIFTDASHREQLAVALGITAAGHRDQPRSDHPRRPGRDQEQVDVLVVEVGGVPPPVVARQLHHPHVGMGVDVAGGVDIIAIIASPRRGEGGLHVDDVPQDGGDVERGRVQRRRCCPRGGVIH